MSSIDVYWVFGSEDAGHVPAGTRDFIVSLGGKSSQAPTRCFLKFERTRGRIVTYSSAGRVWKGSLLE